MIQARAKVSLLLIVAACGGEREPPVSPSRPSPAAAVAPAAGAPDVAAPSAFEQEAADDGESPPPRPLVAGGSRSIGGGAEPQGPKWHGRRIDLDLKGADLHEVCRLIAEVGHVNIVVTDAVQGSITIRMRGVPWDQALDTILRAKGYRAERDGNVITVTK